MDDGVPVDPGATRDAGALADDRAAVDVGGLADVGGRVDMGVRLDETATVAVAGVAQHGSVVLFELLVLPSPHGAPPPGGQGRCVHSVLDGINVQARLKIPGG